MRLQASRGIGWYLPVTDTIKALISLAIQMAPIVVPTRLAKYGIRM